jgi:hypothetical protein
MAQEFSCIESGFGFKGKRLHGCNLLAEAVYLHGPAWLVRLLTIVGELQGLSKALELVVQPSNITASNGLGYWLFGIYTGE